MNNALAEQIRQGQLDADLNVRYAEAIALTYRHRHLAGNVVCGLCTAGTVTALVTKLVSPVIGITLNSVASLVTTIVLPQFKWQKIEGEAISERKAWAILKADFDLLAISDDSDAEKKKEFTRLHKASAKQQGNGVILPRLPKLQRKIELAVATYHKLEGSAPSTVQ
jgi:hypothetical protein